MERVRHRITVSIALATASVIAVTPTTAPVPHVRVLAIQLTAGFDPLGLWENVFNTASTNATTIAQDYFEAPLPVLQQSIVNQVNFLGDFLNNPSSIGSIFTDIWGNVTASALAPFSPFTPGPGSDLTGSLDIAHQTLFSLANTLLPDQQSLLEFSASPSAGWLLGDLGTVLSPTLQFIDDLTGIFNAITGPTPDWTTAVQDLINMPANLTGAWLNGYGPYDLLPLLDTLGVELPSLGSFGNITALDVDLGGLLSPGGSLFNALGVEAGITVLGRPVTLLDVNGIPAGPLASLVQMTQSMSQAIGWDTVGNPLAHLVFPTLDWFGAGSQAALGADAATQFAADVNTLWSDLAGAV